MINRIKQELIKILHYIRYLLSKDLDIDEKGNLIK